MLCYKCTDAKNMYTKRVTVFIPSLLGSTAIPLDVVGCGACVVGVVLNTGWKCFCLF